MNLATSRAGAAMAEMQGPGGTARTPWAEELLLRYALARVQEARQALAEAEALEQAVRHLISRRKLLEQDLERGAR